MINHSRPVVIQHSFRVMLILHNYVAVERTATITQKKIVMANKYVKVQS